LEIGVDIVEIQRIAKAVRNPRFLKRVFTATEVAYCRSRKNSAQHFAVRFAAKEAVWKAIATATVRRPSGGVAKASAILHRDIQVRNRPDGKPEVLFPKPFSGLARRVSISLSHGRDYAVAMAVYNAR
jgi:holo-[acyl-carrier protein] synthase